MLPGNRFPGFVILTLLQVLSEYLENDPKVQRERDEGLERAIVRGNARFGAQMTELGEAFRTDIREIHESIKEEITEMRKCLKEELREFRESTKTLETPTPKSQLF